jgi:hypothetical protein
VNSERALVSGLLLVAVAFVVGLDVAVCPMAGVLGIPCPSCGMTRATVALVVGDIRRSWAIHPGLLPALVYLGAAALAWRFWRRNTAVVRGVTIGGIILLCCLALVWGARYLGHFGGPVPVHPWFRH